MDNPNKFYVYEHWRPDRDECFYVGKGHGKRANNLNNRNPHHKAIQKKLAVNGTAVEVRIVADMLDECDAFKLEMERVSFWRNAGIALANKSDGGEGPSGMKHTEEWKIEQSRRTKGIIRSEETKARMSAAGKGKRLGQKRTPEQCARMSAALKGISHGKGRKLSDEHRAKLSAVRLGKRRSAEAIAHMVAAQIGHVVSRETRAKIGAANKGRIISEEHRRKLAEANMNRVYEKGRIPSEETRKKMSESQKRRQQAIRDNQSVGTP
jgi:hypothetical protein